ncbi:tail fiber assembly protein [Aeromonas veronii]|uniref:tail fiber assembly protein n=1 Tax=Aeromonas veronii TaxID=654 RepID=UPI00123AA426|nr:tail fiber assembly protein [Aeromonas veronii]QET79797.1 tail fiber assembly protein [Aeromonas veronii]
MGIFFSASAMGFFSSDLYEIAAIPEDAKEIDQTEYRNLLDGMSQGKKLVIDEHGNPDLVALQEPSVNDLSMAEQAARIANANQQIAILKPAVDGGYAKPEHPQLLADWQRCRYELTLVPEQPGWPDKPQWPDQPATAI